MPDPDETQAPPLSSSTSTASAASERTLEDLAAALGAEIVEEAAAEKFYDGPQERETTLHIVARILKTAEGDEKLEPLERIARELHKRNELAGCALILADEASRFLARLTKATEAQSEVAVASTKDGARVAEESRDKVLGYLDGIMPGLREAIGKGPGFTSPSEVIGPGGPPASNSSSKSLGQG